MTVTHAGMERADVAKMLRAIADRIEGGEGEYTLRIDYDHAEVAAQPYPGDLRQRKRVVRIAEIVRFDVHLPACPHPLDKHREVTADGRTLCGACRQEVRE